MYIFVTNVARRLMSPYLLFRIYNRASLSNFYHSISSYSSKDKRSFRREHHYLALLSSNLYNTQLYYRMTIAKFYTEARSRTSVIKNSELTYQLLKINRFRSDESAKSRTNSKLTVKTEIPAQYNIF